MSAGDLTIIVFWSLFGIVMLYDLYQVITRGLPATITYMWWRINKTHPILTFLFGVFCGHLFPVVGFIIPLVVGLGILSTLILELCENGFTMGMRNFAQNHAAVFLSGFLVGFAFWSETDY